MRWSIGDARQHFSTVIRKASEEPQEIFNRDQPVAVLVSAATYREFQEWQVHRAGKDLASDFAEARELCRETAYFLELPDRHGAERDNPFEES